MPEHAISYRFRLWTQRLVAVSGTFEKELEKVVDGSGLGEYDGNELGGSQHWHPVLVWSDATVTWLRLALSPSCDIHEDAVVTLTYGPGNVEGVHKTIVRLGRLTDHTVFPCARRNGVYSFPHYASARGRACQDRELSSRVSAPFRRISEPVSGISEHCRFPIKEVTDVPAQTIIGCRRRSLNCGTGSLKRVLTDTAAITWQFEETLESAFSRRSAMRQYHH